MGVYAAMSGAGGAIGVMLGGILTEELSWRFVLFVNVPIGLAVLIATPRVLGETPSRAGALDLPGALTATGGMTLLVYGLIHAASTSWSTTWTVVPLVAGPALLLAFMAIESRSRHALMPLRLFRDRSRSAGFGVMLAIGTALFAMFYFLTLFIQDVLGYSPLRAGFAYVPFTLALIVTATATAKLVGRIGTKIPLMVGTLLATGGLLWFGRVTPESTYWGGVAEPMFLVAIGMAMCFVPLTLTITAGVRRDEAGIVSALLNSGQQVGGSLGLAVLGTIAATVTRHQAVTVISRFGPPAAALFRSEPPPPSIPVGHALRHAVDLAYLRGYTTAFDVGAGILLGAFIVVATLISSSQRVPPPTDGPRADDDAEVSAAPAVAAAEVTPSPIGG
jgi:MFS family permease